MTVLFKFHFMYRKYPKPVGVFLAALLEENNRLMDKEKVAESPEMLESIKADLLGLPQPRPLSLCKKPSLREKCFQELFYGFQEIAEAYDTLNDVISLVRFTPPKRLHVHKIRYLKFWKDTYFNEFYIFQRRIDAYLGKIARLYDADPIVRDIGKIMKLLRKAVASSTKDFMEVRAAHVHTQRYSATDDDMRRLNLLEILVEHGGRKELRKLHTSAFREGQRRTIKNFLKWNSSARNIMSQVFKLLNRILLDKQNRLIYPTKTSGMLIVSENE